MDFFTEQDKSRNKTGKLVVLFIMAVIAVIMCVYIAVSSVLFYSSSSSPPGSFAWFNPELMLTIGGITLVVIVIGSLFKIIALSKGGSYVAESLGGRLVSPSTQDFREKRFLNIVEEMSIASGIPVPQVYILDQEKGINAFAAGHSPSDAVVAITRGCCNMLTRDELQGVIAHEFSHILNGDMKLNIRLIGLLSGIMVIANIGYIILRSGGGRRSRSSKDGGGQIMIIAILLLVIGYIGVFMGRLIQSAVSRQREYLADASAVQFTRNPIGIANALKKIGGLSDGSKIISPSASEACHMFFSIGISSLFSTHPPLVERITRLDPGFSASEFKKVKATGSGDAAFSSIRGEGQFKESASQISVSADTVMDQIGNITPEHVSYSSDLLAALPDSIKNELNDIFGASAMICALLLDKDSDEKEKQIEFLSRTAPPEIIRQILIIDKELTGFDPRLRLPVIDLCLPALRMMTSEQYAGLCKYIKVLVETDGKMTVFEFALNEAITHRLGMAYKAGRKKIKYKSINLLFPDVANLIKTLSVVGHKDKAEAQKAFDRAIFNLPLKIDKLGEGKVSFQAVHEALEKFSLSSPGIKKTVFDACAQCVLFDGVVSIKEAELLRAVAYAMDIPAPPIL